MDWLFQWHNAIFTIPILIFFALFLLQVIGFGLDTFLDIDFEPSEATVFSGLLVFFDAEKVPVGLLLLTFCALFGTIGLVLNWAAELVLGRLAAVSLAATVPLAFIGSVFATRVVTGILAKIMPAHDSSAETRQGLVGLTATVLSKQVDEKGGRARVRDRYGNFVPVFCRMLEGEAAVPKGRDVLLVEYEDEKQVYMCSVMDDPGA